MKLFFPLKNHFLAVIVALGGTAPICEALALSPMTKPAALQTLRDWRGRVIAQDEAQSFAQKKQITSLSKMTLKYDGEELQAPILEIARLDGERVELEARRRIVDQLIFAIDTKWSGNDLKGFLEIQLLELATNDLAEPGEGGWWKFLTQASVALRETAEPGADPIRFLDYYMSESGVIDPKPAKDILKLRTYVR